MSSDAPTIISKFQAFSQFILENRNTITPRVFSQHYSKFVKKMERDAFCSESEKLAETLCTTEGNNFAGIIYSTLCKLTEFFPNELENFALKGYEVAKANGDYVHMMARLNNLRKVYINRPDKLYNYIQVLYKQEKCLKQLTNHYDECMESYNSIIRNPATKEQYTDMLAHVQTEIAKLTRKKHPHDAMRKLLSAREIFYTQNDEKSLQYVDFLISEIGTFCPDAVKVNIS